MCASGSTQWAYILLKKAASTTTAPEVIIATGVVDANQIIYVMTLDIPNTFVQTEIALDEDKIITNKREQLIDIIFKICPRVYNKYARYKGGQKIISVRMLKSIYVMLVSSILYYKKLRKDIEAIVFEVNPYDIFAANQMK